MCLCARVRAIIGEGEKLLYIVESTLIEIIISKHIDITNRSICDDTDSERHFYLRG